MQIAIDTGGTFTDCVYFDGGKLRVLKVFSTPSDPGQAVLDALRSIDAQGQLNVRHGTTVGTNAMLERKGARVAFVTTAGFEETIAIGRQARARLYDWARLPRSHRSSLRGRGTHQRRRRASRSARRALPRPARGANSGVARRGGLAAFRLRQSGQ
jgi:N-methylhydantoinase A/oxoprolinase/acetone carboxylase beta subunit